MLLLNDENGTKVEAFEATNLRNPEAINHDVFKDWLKGSGAQPVTWRTLVMALKKIGLSEVVAEMERVWVDKHIGTIGHAVMVVNCSKLQ